MIWWEAAATGSAVTVSPVSACAALGQRALQAWRGEERWGGEAFEAILGSVPWPLHVEVTPTQTLLSETACL